jgi:hypothetical protein
MVRVPGLGLADAQLKDLARDLGREFRGQRGCAFDDEQFNALLAHLDFGVSWPGLRRDLDSIREVVVKGQLYEDRKPARNAVHKALGELATRLGSFLNSTCIEATGLNWHSQKQYRTAFHVFISLPTHLRAIADAARVLAKDDSVRRDYLLALSESAGALVGGLLELDAESKNEVLGALPWDRDYSVNSLDDVKRIARLAFDATNFALEIGKKRGGPKPLKHMETAVAMLAEVYERCGGKLTHTPRRGTEYDGAPRSRFGQFVLAFVKMCEPSITPQRVSQWIADLIRSRNNRDKPPKLNRETSP